MNREIKFRVWDKKSKKMRELDMISFHNSRGCFDHDDSNLPKLITVWGRDCINDKDIILRREEGDFVLMQFAGLPDKKGVDAYENDLAKHPSSKHLFEIVFYKGAFWLQSQEPSLLKNNIKTNISHLEFCEIIGNSFTNPELINK